MIELVKEFYELVEVDTGDLGKFKAKGMNFVTRHFDAEGLGSVSVMSAKGMMGLMKMETIIVNPFFVDAPLFSYDKISVMGKDILYLEMFNTCIGDKFDISNIEAVRNTFNDYPEHELGEHWYDFMRVGTPVCVEVKGKAKAALAEDAEKYIKAVLEACKAAEPCDATAKKEKAKVYSEGLLTNGGPATDPVKEQLGEEATGEFFRKVLFATD